MDNDDVDIREALSNIMGISYNTMVETSKIAAIVSSQYVLSLTIARKLYGITDEELAATLEALQALANADEYNHTSEDDGEPLNGPMAHTEAFDDTDKVVYLQNRSKRKN